MSRNKGKGRGKKEEEVEEEKSSEEETEEQRLEREHKRLLEHRKMREQKAKELAERKAKEAEEAAARAAQRGETPEDQEEEPKEDKNTKGKKGQKKQDEQQQEEEKEEEGEGEEDDEDSIGARILKGELIYCPTCGLPPEFCEWGPDFNKCKPWILKNCPQLYPKLAEEAAKKNAAAGGEKQGDGEKKKQKRGGKGQPKPAKEAPEEAEDDDSKKVTISIAKRGNHKHNTTVHNLEAFGVPLKTASQIFRKKFATGSNPVSNGAITIQGDIVDDLIELICDQDWGITEDDIVTLEEGKKIQTRKKNSRPRGKKGGRSGAFPNPSSNLNA